MFNPFETDRQGRRIILPEGHAERQAMVQAAFGSNPLAVQFLRTEAASAARRAVYRPGQTLDIAAYEAGRLAMLEDLIRDIDTMLKD